MNEQATNHLPTEIKLHAKSRVLSLAFADGANYELPAEYLRVFSTAAEVRSLDRPVTGKEEVNIERIEPQGQYAIRILFDDGHDTGIYSWDSLYSLGRNKDANWSSYLERLEEMSYQRQEPEQAEKRVKLLYFAWLATKLRKESEQMTLPPSITDVDTLLVWLGRRRRGAEPLFAKERLRVTVNKQFSEGFTKLHEGDEIGVIPSTPTAPATPDFV